MSSPWKEEQEATPRTSTPLSIEAFAEDLRLFNRSPHPYHRSRRLGSCTPSEHGDRLQPLSSYSRSSRTTSDSGTEADDESTGILRGLPAPPLRPRKGLRLGPADLDDWLPSLQPWPSFVRPMFRTSRRSSEEELEEEAFEARLRFRRQRRVEVLRRLLEAALLLSVGGVVLYQDGARSLAWEWRKGMCETDIPIRKMECANLFCRNCCSWPSGLESLCRLSARCSCITGPKLAHLAHLVYEADILLNTLELRSGSPSLSDPYSDLRFVVVVQPYSATYHA